MKSFKLRDYNLISIGIELFALYWYSCQYLNSTGRDDRAFLKYYSGEESVIPKSGLESSLIKKKILLLFDFLTTHPASSVSLLNEIFAAYVNTSTHNQVFHLTELHLTCCLTIPPTLQLSPGFVCFHLLVQGFESGNWKTFGGVLFEVRDRGRWMVRGITRDLVSADFQGLGDPIWREREGSGGCVFQEEVAL